jgi:uncharacterized protein (DUF427 family)
MRIDECYQPMTILSRFGITRGLQAGEGTAPPDRDVRKRPHRRHASGYRVLEPSRPPTYYFPPTDVALALLRGAEGNSLCEFKGVAEYRTISVGDRVSVRAAWIYPRPLERYEEIAGHFAFYPSRVDACLVGHEQAIAQEGDFYCGWITSGIRGLFKGGPGSAGW